MMGSTPELSTPVDLQQRKVSSTIQFSVWHTFKHHIPRFIITTVVDIILPLVIYFSLQAYIKPVYALLVASSPPLFMVIFKAVWFCTFDALGFLVFITFAISALVAIITRNPIILLLEKSLVTAILSLIFAITLIPFHCCSHRCRIRPLAYYLYQDLVPTRAAEIGLPETVFNDADEPINDQYAQLQEGFFESNMSSKEEVSRVYQWIYAHCPPFRYSCYTITIVWSIGFLLEFFTRLILILIHLPISHIVLYSHLILSTITVICITLTIISIAVERKRTLTMIQRWSIGQRQRQISEVLTETS